MGVGSLLAATVFGASCGHGAAEKPAADAPTVTLTDAGVADSRRDTGPPIVPTTVIEVNAVVSVELPRDAVCKHAPGKADPALPGKCRRDSDCSERAYGRCNAVSRRGEAPELDLCVYDECVSDSECDRVKPGTICFCSSGAGSSGNRCGRGDCRGDSDCAPGEKCASEHAFFGNQPLDGQFCTTQRDACKPWNDGPCGQSACVYATSARHWQCTPGSTRGLAD